MHDTRPKPFAFVLMPFSQKFNDVYELGIKAACEMAGVYCERVDEQMFEEGMLDRIYNQIAKADVIIAEMTGLNPNVFYETGYAHALGKRVLMLTQNGDEIPFNLQNFQHIVYDGHIKYLKDELVKRVEWAITHPKDNSELFSASLRYMIQGVEVLDGAESYIVEYFDDESRSLERSCQIDIFNLSNSTINAVQLRVSLLLEDYSGPQASLMPDGKYLHKIPCEEEIYPGTHESVKIKLHVPDGIDHEKLVNPGVVAELKETTKFGMMTRKLRLKLVTREKLEAIAFKKGLQMTQG